MFDLHCHLLPGIDDGAQSDAEALALARVAVQNGISHAVLTPHFHPGRYENSRADVETRAEALRALLRAHDVPLTLGIAGEVRAGPEAMELLATGELPILGSWKGMRVVLLEFPHSHLPVGSERLVAWMIRQGIRPMVAHPERNKDVIRDLERIAPLIGEGALLQVTADSVSGGFGPLAQARAVELLERGWVTVLASDAHNLEHRPPRLEPGRRAASDIVGEDEAWRLVHSNPGAIMLGEEAMQVFAGQPRGL